MKKKQRKFFILLSLVATFMVGSLSGYTVSAQGGPPNPGHTISEIECSDIICLGYAGTTVGIGIDTPPIGPQLTVGGQLWVTYDPFWTRDPFILIAKDSSVSPTAHLQINDARPGGKLLQINNGNTDAGGAGKAGFMFDGNQILTMDAATSNVGIGTNSPTGKLEVVGDFVATTNQRADCGWVALTNNVRNNCPDGKYVVGIELINGLPAEMRCCEL